MRLKVFQSDQGDCILLTGEDGTRILADGGMRSSYREHVAPALGRLQRAGSRLDLLYVSHIDRDHIGGVLQLLDDLVEWRVHDFQQKSGNKDFPKPKQPRPPDPKRLWHNAFHDQLDKNAGEIHQLLAATASVLEAGSDDPVLEQAETQRDLATSVPEGLELARRASAEQLDIDVNKEFGGNLILVRDQDKKRNTVTLGSLKLTVIGPFKKELEVLREEWNDWLRKNGKALEDLRKGMRADADRLAAGGVDGFRAGLAMRARELGDINRVTAPNLASLMLMVEEGQTTVLMPGDGHAKHILAGLEHAGRLKNGGIHVDVLKVQHHGAEFNIDREFCKAVSADNYVFCGNGAHGNPDLRALQAIIDSRLGPKTRRSENPGAERPFKLWFNSSSKVPGRARNQAHMRAVEDLAAKQAKASNGTLSHAFLDQPSFELRV